MIHERPFNFRTIIAVLPADYTPVKHNPTAAKRTEIKLVNISHRVKNHLSVVQIKVKLI